MPRLPLALLLLLAVGASGCDSSGGSFDISPYIGTYSGTRTETIGSSEKTEDAMLTIAADEVARTVTITFTPEIGPDDVMRGTYDENGIVVSFSQSGITYDFSIDEEGDVTGTYSILGQGGTIGGVLTPVRFDLTLASRSATGIMIDIRTRR